MANGIKYQNNQIPAKKIKLADVKVDFQDVDFLIFTNMGTIDTSEYNIIVGPVSTSGLESVIHGGSISGYWLANKLITGSQSATIDREHKIVFVSDEYIQRIVIKGKKNFIKDGRELNLPVR